MRLKLKNDVCSRQNAQQHMDNGLGCKTGARKSRKKTLREAEACDQGESIKTEWNFLESLKIRSVTDT